MFSRKIGRYQIKEEIGRGGMATVYRAFDPNFNREVAVKVLPREMMHNLKFRAQFKRELKTIALLEHPAIVPVHDVGEEGGQSYFVMRYMSGGSLSSMLEKGKFSLQDTARIIERVALALDHAHSQGIIHRDIKPDNILFDSQNNPYISDFGVAKITEAAYSATQDGRIIGTPGYMSPEQANGQKVDRRSDIYGMGAMVYQMLNGKPAYEYETNAPLATILKHVNEPVPEILKENPELPESVDVVIKKSMAKNKEDRYATAVELARALNLAAFGEDRILHPSTTIVDRPTIPRYLRRMSPVWWISGMVILLLFIGTLALRGQLPFFSLASTPTLSPSPVPVDLSPLETPTPVQPTSTPTVEITLEVPVTPGIPGGADQVALVSGNQIYLMSVDGSGLIQIRTDNSPKSNLQWITGNRLVYLSRNCASMVHGDTKQNEQIVCFDAKELLEGFRVSPDGKLAAISIQRTLNIFPFDLDRLKEMDTRFNMTVSRDNCFYNQYPFRDVLWSNDEKQLAARVVDTRVVQSDQIFLVSVDIPNCITIGPTRLDKIPGTRITFEKDSTKRVASFDWDGKKLFLLNDVIRNDGFGNLYLYNSETREASKINPINGQCCYRDARWSPDGTYIMFAYQRFDRSAIELYYVPLADIQSGKPLTPINLPDGFFSISREAPQPALRPVQ